MRPFLFGIKLSNYCLIFCLLLISFFSISNGLCEDLVVDGATYYVDSIKSDVTATSAAGITDVSVSDGTIFSAGQNVLIINMNGTYIGQYETNVISSVSSNTLTLQNPLANTYTADAQVIVFTQYDAVQVINSGSLTCSAYDNNVGGVLYLKATSLVVDATSTLTTSEKGYPQATGPGAGASHTSRYAGGGGGSHGGEGSNGQYTEGGAGYGSVVNPAHMGSGGGYTTYRVYSGGIGGGIILLDINGTLTISGSIQANGQTAPNGGSYSMCGGGGAGGTINITAGTFDGSGNLSADGGSRMSTYTGGGGSGGRIAVQCSATTFSGTYSSAGGSGYYQYAGAGTIYLNNNGTTSLTIKNNTTAGREPTNITADIPSDIDSYSIQNATANLVAGVVITGNLAFNGNMTLYNNGSITPPLFTTAGSSNQLYNNASGSVVLNSFDCANLYFKNDGQLTVQDKHLQINSSTTFVLPHVLTETDYDLTVNSGGTFVMQTNQVQDFVNVIVNDGGTITHQANNTTAEGQMYNINIHTTEDFIVNAGATVSASNKGYAANNGPGTGTSSGSKYAGGGGGAYGGDGSNGRYTEGGAGYGSVVNPVHLGSAGGSTTYTSYLGGAGGGAVFLTIDGTLAVLGTIQVNGQTAPTGGGSYSMCGGGGSGGTINITAIEFEGSGTLSANGGSRLSTYYGGGGGGGRIAVQCTTNSYTGTYFAVGGDGYDQYGGAGTIYINNNGTKNLIIRNNTSAARELTTITSDIPSDVDYITFTNTTIQLNSGVQINGELAINGYVNLYSNTSITPSLFTISGSSNQIYNNASGSIVFASFDYSNLYFKNDGQITVQDKHLQINSSTTFVLTHVLTESDYDLTVNSGGTFLSQINQQQDFVNVTVNSGGTITHQANNTTAEGQMYNINIHTTEDFIVNAGATVSASSKGYAANNGPGTGTSSGSKYAGGGGGAYGGDGSNGRYTEGGAGYGSVVNPVNLGSAGGSTTYTSYLGGAGGGAVFLTIDGTLAVLGTIQANGQTAPTGGGSYSMCGGGGSGGTINITAIEFEGSGTLSANGGSRLSTYYGGGGGGGRIAVQCTTNSYTGSYFAVGGGGYYQYGGAGTIYLNNNSVTSILIKNNTSAARELTAIFSDIPSDIDYITIENATVELAQGAQITGELLFSGNVIFYNNTAIIPSLFSITGSANQIYNSSTGSITFASYSYSNLYFKNDGQVTIQDKILEVASGSTFVLTHVLTESDYDLTVNSGGIFLSQTNQQQDFVNVTVNDGGTITHQANNTTAEGQMYNINIHTTEDFIVNAGATVSASSKGYAANNGPGTGTSSGSKYAGGGGGAYGGDGSNGRYTEGGAGYGSVINPVNLGSAGGSTTYTSYLGGAGGGAVFLTIDGTLAVLGTIQANGQTAPTGGGSYSMCGGGGSGGTINITAIEFEGSGTLSANGGSRLSTYYGGGGGGGRIAVQCTTNSYTGSYFAVGGGGYYQYGGAGTIYINDDGIRTVIIRNNTTAGRDITTITADIPSDIEYYSVQNATLQLLSGVQINGEIAFNGNIILYNNTAITPSLFTITGSTTEIYNNTSGSVLFASYDYDNLYFKNDGHITIEDKHLQVGSASSFVLTHALTASDYDLTVKNGGTFLSQTNQQQDFVNVTVNDGGTITHQANNTTAEGQMYNINIHTTEDFIVNAGATVSASNKGYAANNGPGTGTSSGSRRAGGGGGAYGGDGSNGQYTEGGAGYGSVVNPMNLGSAGGSTTYTSYLGGAGGGAVFLTIDGTLAVLGTIQANGQTAPTGGGSYSMCGGGGSGGTINVTAIEFEGSGTLSANGGSRLSTYYGGGGGGGRIAVQCTTNSYTGSYFAVGGGGYYQYGGAGTIYINDDGMRTVIIRNSTTAGRDITTITADIPSDIEYYSVQNATLHLLSGVQINGDLAFNGNLTLQNYTALTPAVFSISGSSTYIYNNSGASVAFTSYNYPSLYFRNDGQISIQDKTLEVKSGSTFIASHDFAVADNNLIIRNGGTFSSDTTATLNFDEVIVEGVMTHSNNSTTALGERYKLNVHSSSNFTVRPEGQIYATGKGYSEQNGPGVGGSSGTKSSGGGGGGYGGAGSAGYLTTAGVAYGDMMNPTNLGSGGGSNTYYSLIGAAGGGAVSLDVDGLLALNGVIVVEGVSSGNMGSYSSADGPGSGGSVKIDAVAMGGYGSVSADGGSRYPASVAGGGAGGRIAVYCPEYYFTGSITAEGGDGYYQKGDNGTIYMEVSSSGAYEGPLSNMIILLPGETFDPSSATGKSGTPTEHVAGVPFDVTVIAVDALYNVKTDVSDTVRMVSTQDTAQVTPAQQTFSSTGQLTFTVTEYAASDLVINLDDLDDDRFDKSSATYSIAPTDPAKMQIILPGETLYAGSAAGVSGTPDNQVGRVAFNATVRLVDQYYNKISGRTDAVTLISSNPNAVIPSFSLTNGTATVTLTEMELGADRQLTAHVDDAQIQDGLSSLFDVVAGPLKELVVLMPGETFTEGVGKSGTPDPVVAGTSFDVTVIAVDDSYNTKGDLSHLIAPVSNQTFMTISPASARFSGNTGTLVFNVTQYIAESDISMEILDHSSHSFDTATSIYSVVSRPASQLQVLLPGEFAYPGSALGKTGTPTVEIVGVPFNVTVNLVDEYFNPVAGRTDEVALTSSSGSATIPLFSLADGTATVSVTETVNGLDITLSASIADVSIPDKTSEQYDVFYKIPSIFSVTPSVSRPGLYQVLTIDGENFTDGASLSITGNGIVLNSFDIVSETQISAEIYIEPTASVGYRDVVLTNPDFAVATGENMFRVRDPDPPVISNYSYPSEARTGDIITVTFDVNELLGADPIVRIDGNYATLQDNDSGSFTYTYEVTGSEHSGYVYVQIRATDFVGNVGYVTKYMVLDLQAPVIGYKKIDPAVISPNGNGINDETKIGFNIYDEHDAFSAEVVVKDSSGTIVKELWSGTLEDPYYRGSWDGSDNDGVYLTADVYTVEATVTDLGNSDVVNAVIGTVTIDYDADEKRFIVFDDKNIYQTVDYSTYSIPVVITNNDTLAVKSLSEMEVILTDSSVNGSFVEDPSTITLNPGESTIVHVSVDTTIAASSMADLLLRIEGDDSTEIDYANLRLYINPVPKPDLVMMVSDMTFTPKNPDADQNCVVSVKVKNIGSAAAEATTVAFTSFGQPIGEGSKDISALDVGEEVTVSTTIQYSSEGRKLVQIEVDPLDTVDELDEYNNDVSKILEVGDGNVLSGGIRVLAVAPGRVQVGELVEITGRADYAIEINGEMNYDYPVKGGSVTLFLKTTSGYVVMTRGGIYTYGGERSGEYIMRFRIPSIFQDGDYALARIVVTDSTFVGSIQVAIEVYDPSTEPSTAFDPAVVHGSEILGDPDIDGDGIPNYYDPDIDGDLILNEDDTTPYGGGGYYGGSGGGYVARSNPVVLGDGSYYYPRSAGIRFQIPDGSKIYPGMGESVVGEYQGVSYDPADYPYDAYVHSCDIAFSNDNPDQFEEIYIGAIVWAEGAGYKEVPVSFFEIYPAGESISKIGVTQMIPRLEAQRNASVVTSWQNQGEGIYIIEAHLDTQDYSAPDEYTDGNNLNNEASRAIIVGEFNELLDVVVNSPLENVTYVCLKDTIAINFEVWRGLDSLSPDELDILTVMFDDSLALTRDLIIVQDGVLVNGEYNEATGVYSISIPAPLPVGDAVNGLYPGSIMVAAQTHSDENEMLNGGQEVGINLTLSANPPETMSLTCTPCESTLTWSEVPEGVSQYNIYRNNTLIATVDHPETTYVDDTVDKDETYEYFVMSVSSATSLEGIVTSPVDDVTIEKMTPIIDAGSDQNVSVNEVVLFEGTITDDGCDDPYIYAWDFGDESYSDGTLTPSHTYSESGTYTVSLTVVDEYGTEYTDMLLVEVTRTVIGVNVGEDQTVDEGSTVNFLASITDGSSTDTYQYAWNFGDGDNDSGSLSATHVYADNGAYTVTITVTDSESSAVGSDSLSVNVNNVAPSVTVDPDFIVYEGDSVELLSTSYTDPGSADTHTADVDWNDGTTDQFPVDDGTVSLSHIYTDYGSYTVTIQVTDDDSGIGTETMEVSVLRKPIALTIHAEDDLSATISFTGVAGKTYEIWYSDDPFATFGNTFAWTVADTVTATDSGEFATTYTDNGDSTHPGVDGIPGTADDGRSAPYLTDTRYYRVVVAGSVAAGDPWASEDIAFYHGKDLYEQRNYVGKMGAGQDQTLNEIIDCRFLPGGLTMQASTVAMYWDNDDLKSAYVFDWDSNKSWSDGTFDVTNGTVDSNNGLIITIPPGNGTQLVPMVGIVEMADSVSIDIQPSYYNLVAWPYADAVELDNSGLLESGLEGGMTARTSDQIYFWDAELQRYELPVFYSSVANEWRNYDQTPCTRKIYPGEAVLIKTKSSSGFTNWTVQRKYIKSKNILE